MREALWYEKAAGDRLRCRLCPHECLIPAGKTGICEARRNEGGRLVSLNYGRCSSLAWDPVEKKPLYHFYPGRSILSIGTIGCSFHCQFCQNWEIARSQADTFAATPEQILDILRTRSPKNNIGVAYTYSEPLVWYEFVLETARAVKAAGYKNVLVTNGFIQEDPLADLLPYIDALNIDVKGFNREFYHRIVHGNYEPVLHTARMSRAAGCLVEITTLLVPTLNDDPGEIRELVAWVAGDLGVETPLHFSRYFPNYRMDLPPTPPDTLRRLRDIARQRLAHVYLGNIWGEDDDTYCPRCHSRVIARSGYQAQILALEGNRCAACGRELNLVND